MSRDHPNHERDWDDDAFRQRAIALCRAQNRSPSEVCTTAGLTNDYLARAHKTGRNIRALIALARELRVPPMELISGPSPATADSAILRRLALIGHVAAHLYVSLDTERRPTETEVERIVGILMDLIHAPAAGSARQTAKTED